MQIQERDAKLLPVVAIIFCCTVAIITGSYLLAQLL